MAVTDETKVQMDEADGVDEERVMLDGLHEAESPEDGLTPVVIVNVPVNPEDPVSVAVVLPEVPELNVTLDGLAMIPKSGAGCEVVTVTVKTTL